MTEGHGTCGQPTGGRKRPQRGRTTSSLVLFAPFGDDWGEKVYYPQVAFPSVIPPAVIHIRPLRGQQDAACETSVKFYYYLLSFNLFSAPESFLMPVDLPKVLPDDTDMLSQAAAAEALVTFFANPVGCSSKLKVMTSPLAEPPPII